MPKFDTATSNSALSNGRSWGVKRTLSCGRIAYEIDTLLDRHKVEDNPVLRRERVDIFSAVLVRFSEGVLCALGREQAACLGKRDPSALVRLQCRQWAGRRGVGGAVELGGIGRIVAGSE